MANHGVRSARSARLPEHQHLCELRRTAITTGWLIMASTTPSHLPPHLRHDKSQHPGLQVSSSIAQPSVGSISGVDKQRLL
jgi:hypothetical protein